VSQTGWTTRTIALVLYPFGAGAMATNVFFASLLGSWVGLPVLSAYQSVAVGALIGVPATWAFARHIRHLMDKAAP
jgi:divalent metal cation (Fe/Co/Zn/Cd) transporter